MLRAITYSKDPYRAKDLKYEPFLPCVWLAQIIARLFSSERENSHCAFPLAAFDTIQHLGSKLTQLNVHNAPSSPIYKPQTECSIRAKRWCSELEMPQFEFALYHKPASGP